jgi:hypothetical protein
MAGPEDIQEPTREVQLYSGDQSELTLVDSSQPKGISIVGMAQAGKTTLRNIIDQSWHEFDPRGATLTFSNSNGFRGLTAAALQYGDHDLARPICPDVYMSYLRGFLAEQGKDVGTVLDAFYTAPADEHTVLRSKAVDGVVPYTSEDAHVRPLVNAAGARYMRRIVAEPDLAGLHESPGLVIIDGRNQGECVEKFQNAEVRAVGTFVLVCPERVVARRKVGTYLAQAFWDERTALTRRNQTDANRAVGRMTVPADLSRQHVLHELLRRPDAYHQLYESGKAVARDPESGFVVCTNKLSVAAETKAMPSLWAGMLTEA